MKHKYRQGTSMLCVDVFLIRKKGSDAVKTKNEEARKAQKEGSISKMKTRHKKLISGALVLTLLLTSIGLPSIAQAFDVTGFWNPYGYWSDAPGYNPYGGATTQFFEYTDGAYSDTNAGGTSGSGASTSSGKTDGGSDSTGTITYEEEEPDVPEIWYCQTCNMYPLIGGKCMGCGKTESKCTCLHDSHLCSVCKIHQAVSTDGKNYTCVGCGIPEVNCVCLHKYYAKVVCGCGGTVAVNNYTAGQAGATVVSSTRTPTGTETVYVLSGANPRLNYTATSNDGYLVKYYGGTESSGSKLIKSTDEKNPTVVTVVVEKCKWTDGSVDYIVFHFAIHVPIGDLIRSGST